MKESLRVIIFSTVWPEPSSSAAGVRQIQWVQFFKRMGYQVILASPAKEKLPGDWGTFALPEGVERWHLPLNRNAVQERFKELHPDVVMFDRFILEEQFGHMVYEACPEALVLLETQDLHFVRRARESVREQYLGSCPSPAIYRTDTAIRETASILRVDHAFVVSAFEQKLLEQEFEIKRDRASWVPFFYDEPRCQGADLPFTERKDFVWVGNFRHAPNLDGLRWFRAEIWPKIRKEFPLAQFKIFGAYPSEEVMGFHQPAQGVLVKGSAGSLDEVFASARVSLAPLRFGAGVKGKILESWRYGVPVVTTSVGAEGLLPDRLEAQFPGLIADQAEAFARESVRLYQDESLWTLHHLATKPLMQDVFSVAANVPRLQECLHELRQARADGKIPTWNSKILRHELFNSHRYFSKWIEAKETQLKK